MAADSLFPLALLPVIASMLLQAGNRRNYSFIVILACAAQANLYWHLEMSGLAAEWAPNVAERAQQLMLHLLLIMIAVIGGRVIPMFSANWMQGQGRPLTIRHPVWL